MKIAGDKFKLKPAHLKIILVICLLAGIGWKNIGDYSIILNGLENNNNYVFSFIFPLLTYASIAGIVAIIANLESAWLAPLVLALFPRFWGNSFLNFDDISAIGVFTLATFLGACLIGFYLSAETQTTKIGKNKITLYSCLYGILLGIVTGFNLGGPIILCFFILAHLLTSLLLKDIYIKLQKYAKLYLLIFGTCALTATLLYPRFFESLAHQHEQLILFDGQYIPEKELPWYYLIRLFTITMPVVWQVCFAMGIVLIICKYRQVARRKKACLILVCLQILLVPVLANISGLIVHDSRYYLLLILPAIAVISTMGLIWTYQILSNRHLRIFATVFLLIQVSPVVIDMTALHPYQYVYFNRSYGGLKVAHGKQETDYLAASLDEAREWLKQNAPANSPLLVAGLTGEFVAPPSPHSNSTNLDTSDYYIAIFRPGYHQSVPECPVVHAVSRQKTPLTIIKKCQDKKA
jgi:hypothetical protein